MDPAQHEFSIYCIHELSERETLGMWNHIFLFEDTQGGIATHLSTEKKSYIKAETNWKIKEKNTSSRLKKIGPDKKKLNRYPFFVMMDQDFCFVIMDQEICYIYDEDVSFSPVKKKRYILFVL